MDEQNRKIEPDRGRQGVKGHNVRYVLAYSMAGLVVGYLIALAVLS